MRNPNESEAERDARHAREHAQERAYTERRHEEELASLRKQLQDLKNESPDPAKWDLIDEHQFGSYLCIRVKYPNCKNHKGVKIMVYKATLSQLVKQKLLDPHFGSDDSTKITGQPMAYPVARFAPTDEGWGDAMKYARVKDEAELKRSGIRA